MFVAISAIYFSIGLIYAVCCLVLAFKIGTDDTVLLLQKDYRAFILNLCLWPLGLFSLFMYKIFNKIV